MSTPHIRRIRAEQTHELRRRLLRDNRPEAVVAFDGDDAPDTVHFGAFVDRRLVGVASVYRHERPDAPRVGDWQLRGMAVEPDCRGGGHGRGLVVACAQQALAGGGRRLWCNARQVAVDFYARCGFEVCSDAFEIPEIGPHYRMTLQLAGASSAGR